MGKWITCTIADIGTVVGGATPSTKKAENYDRGTIAWITPKDLADFSASGSLQVIRQSIQKVPEIKACSIWDV